jgi:hypothetical protein
MHGTGERIYPQDWGLPDWRDGGAYPNHESAEPLKWCWEFLRRNPEYREFWERVERAEQALGPLDRPLTTSLDGSAKVRISDGGTLVGVAEAEERFGLWRAYDPRLSESGAQFNRFGATYFTGSPGLGEQAMPVPEGKVAILFDPFLPIEPQLKSARVTLQSLGRARSYLSGQKAKSEARPRVQLFANYLRILDAKEAGVSDREIAKLLFPRLDEDTGIKNVQNQYKAAKRMRDVDFRIYASAAAG